MSCAPFLALLLAQTPVASTRPAEPAPVLELRNGHWFDGQRFEERTLYSVDGRFVAERPAKVERTLDLGGGYVVPPFAEAHNHNVHDGADAALAKYIQQ